MQKMGYNAFFAAMPTATTQEKVGITRRAIQTHDKIVCSISGGSDSDDMLRVVWECDDENKVRYVFFDTGLELQATKDHIEYLQELYGITIDTVRPKVSCASAVREYGYPFFSKMDAHNIHTLQRHGFQWEDEPLKVLMEKYPRMKSALMYWCNAKKAGDHKPIKTEIGRSYKLKKFMMENPPDFLISEKCCSYCKKEPAHRAEKDADLVITGIRQAEGGARALQYTNCFLPAAGARTYDLHMPLFWWTDGDKAAFEERFGIVHSKAYTVYGLTRTGCCGCPFNSKAEQELANIEPYEPQLVKAARNIFAPSYEYRRKYNEYKEREKRFARTGGQLTWEDLQ